MIGQGAIRNGAFYVDVDVGMPLTGKVNLAETPLLMLIGDIRWKQIELCSGVPSKLLVEESGQRVYATFFYVEVRFPPDAPMASLGDGLTIVGTLDFYEEATLDGYHFLYPASWPEDRKVPLAGGEQAIAIGIPFLRTSNAFVRMVKGAAWLKRAVPLQLGSGRVPVRHGLPDAYHIALTGARHDGFRKLGGPLTPLTSGKVKMTYQPDPDRDLNGTGLLYFANYPLVLDIAERRTLSETSRVPFSRDLLDLRTVVHRQSAYLCNIAPSDSIEVLLEAWIENPFLAVCPRPASSPVRLYLNFEMYRRSDSRRMMVSTVEKVIHEKTVDDAGLLGVLERLAAEARSSPG